MNTIIVCLNRVSESGKDLGCAAAKDADNQVLGLAFLCLSARRRFDVVENL